MAGLIGVILVGMALFSVVGVLFVVMRHQHEHEEWYRPGHHRASGAAHDTTAASAAAAEALGTPRVGASVNLDVEVKREAEENPG